MLKKIFFISFVMALVILSARVAFPPPSPSLISEAGTEEMTIRSVSDGYWEDVSTWSENRLPNENDIVEINHKVDVDAIDPIVLGLIVSKKAVLQNARYINVVMKVTSILQNNGTIQSHPYYGWLKIRANGELIDYGNDQINEQNDPEKNDIVSGYNWDGSDDLTFRSLGLAESVLVLTPTIHSTSTAGIWNWNSPSTWIEGRVPNENDIVEINGVINFGLFFASVSGLIINEGAKLYNQNMVSILRINGNVINNGEISNITWGGGRFYVEVSKNIENNSIWTNYQTVLAGNNDRTITGTNSILGNIVLGDSFTLLDSANFDGIFQLNYKTLTINSPHIITVNTITSDGMINGSGIVVIKGGISSVPVFGVPEVYLNGATIYNTNITANDIIVQEEVSVIGSESTIIGSVLIESGAKLYTQNYTPTLTINGDVINNGEVSNITWGGGRLNLKITGNIENNGIWTNYQTVLDGDNNRSITGMALITGNIVLGGSFAILNNAELGGLLVMGDKTITVHDPNILKVNMVSGNGVLGGSGIVVVKGSISSNALVFSVPEAYLNGVIIYNANITANDIIVQEEVSVIGSESTIIGSVLIESGAKLYTQNYTPTLTINGDVINNGEISNITWNGGSLSLKINGNIWNHGIWNNYQTLVTWSETPGAEYQFNITEDQNNWPTPLWKTLNVYNITNYINGEYYWRVRTVINGEYGEWSEVRTINGEVGPEGNSSVIFIPGFQASRLYKDGLVFENQLWEPNRNADVEKLFMDENGNSVDPDIYTKDGEVIKEINSILGIPMGNIYKSFIDDMENLAPDTIKEFKSFQYDWRVGVENIVDHSIKTEDGEYDMITKLEEIADNSYNGKVTIVTHSTGGLVVKYLISRLESMGKADLVDKLIMVACPQYGTPKAIAGLLHGEGQQLPESVGIILDQATARQFGENVLTAYELMPSVKYFENGIMPIIEFDPDSEILAEVRDYYGDSISSSDKLRDFLLGYGRGIKPDSDDYFTPNFLSESFLVQAENLHNILDNWVAPDNVEVVQIAGWGLDTIKEIKYSGQLMWECPLYLADGSDCRWEEHYDYKPVTDIGGDKTVMISSADIMGELDTYYLNLKDYNKVHEFITREHADILEVDSLRILINNIITDTISTLPEYIYDNKDDLVYDNYMRLALLSPVSLDIYDNSDNHTGLINNPDPDSDLRLFEEKIPGSYYMEFGEGKYAGLNTDQEHRIELHGTDYGTFTLEITEVSGDHGEIENTITYKDIPVTPDTVAKITVQDLNNISNLEVDINGDGQTDISVTNSEDTVEPVQYISYIEKYIENSDIEKQLKSYLLAKMKVIKDLFEKNNLQAINAQMDLVEKHIKQMTGKFISVEEMKVLLEIINKLNNLIN